MDNVEARRRIASSRFARLAAFPGRAAVIARYDSALIATSSRWLFTRREHSNYTYDLSPRNVEHLAWWVAMVSGAPVSNCRSWIAEVLHDDDLNEQVIRETLRADRRGLADTQVHVGRRAGWYALVRALKPQHVVETGTDKGLGTLVLAAGILRNGEGRLTTIDVNPDAGYLLGRGKYADVTDIVYRDSVAALSAMSDPIDLFIHDSDHTVEHEAAEYSTLPPLLLPDSLVLSDNAHSTDELARWAESTDRSFLFFGERPLDHWYPGGGIGAAWKTGRQGG